MPIVTAKARANPRRENIEFHVLLTKAETNQTKDPKAMALEKKVLPEEMRRYDIFRADQ